MKLAYTFFPEIDKSRPPPPFPEEGFAVALVPAIDRSSPPAPALLRTFSDELLLVGAFAFLCATIVSLNSMKSPREQSRSKISPLNSSD